MHTYKIHTLGCKVAQAEADQVQRLLERFGLRESARGEAPDLCVVNSCAVTSTAVGKSRRLIGRLARLYPRAKIVLLGCYASVADHSLQAIPQLALIADHHRGILPALEQFLVQSCSGRSDPPCSATSQGDATCNTDIKPFFASKVKNKFPRTSEVASFRGRQPRHRAFLKVQDGCNAACTYCIIPQLRPKIHSLSQAQVLAEARSLLADGHREIVLCGIFLGAYGKETTRKARLVTPGQPLADLVAELAKLPDLGRLRLSSLEPLDLTPELLVVLAGCDKVAGHLHLPLQSGSDTLLRRMGRQYRSADYLRAVARARRAIPDVALTTDVIVGFPGETREDFQATLKVCEQSEFAKIHIFPFSPRPGTPAWDWRNEMLKPRELECRLRELRDLENRLARRFRDRFLGRCVRVLVEELEEAGDVWYCLGRADAYFRVRFPGRPEFDNRFFTARVTETREEPVGAVLNDSAGPSTP
jgi:threonylcarbamoyladenosine tRNA methylthiotransferase MtaB